MEQGRIIDEIKSGRLVREYLADPCRMLSIPYWKAKSIVLPDGMRILHDEDFCGCPEGYTDARYFRLKHDLKNLTAGSAEGFSLKTADLSDIPQTADLINRCYKDISVDPGQLTGYTETPVYDKSLWIIAYETASGRAAGCGIADLDRDLGEGVLEWIQVLPDYRGKGVGRAIVSELLFRMRGRADFATVSGKTDNASKPERLYRKCGFNGGDVWHVLTPKG